MSKRTISFLIFPVILVIFAFFSIIHSPTAIGDGIEIGLTDNRYNYVPMEEIPGSNGRPTDFYVYISYVYKFGIGAVGIAAMTMIVIGGYMYITSAGNNSSMEKAKGVITDAIVGLLLALGSYLILYVINPDLVRIKRVGAISKIEFAEVTFDTITESEAKTQLSAAGIMVANNACLDTTEANCTNFDNIPAFTINRLIQLKEACGSNCPFVITSGIGIATHEIFDSEKSIIDIKDNYAVAEFLKELKEKEQYSNYGIEQICVTKKEHIESISYDYSYSKTCEDHSYSTSHFHLVFTN